MTTLTICENVTLTVCPNSRAIKEILRQNLLDRAAQFEEMALEAAVNGFEEDSAYYQDCAEKLRKQAKEV